MSFQPALAGRELVLSRGDRRDFVVLDHEGGLHALDRRLLGGLFISDDIIEETLGVLREKFRLSRGRIIVAEEFIRACTYEVAPTERLNVVDSTKGNPTPAAQDTCQESIQNIA